MSNELPKSPTANLEAPHICRESARLVRACDGAISLVCFGAGEPGRRINSSLSFDPGCDSPGLALLWPNGKITEPLSLDDIAQWLEAVMAAKEAR